MCKMNIKATVEKLNVKPGECLMVRLRDPAVRPNTGQFDKIFKENLPRGVKWIYMIGDGVDFTVVRSEDVEGG